MPWGVVQGLLEGAAIQVDLGGATAVAQSPDGLVIGFDSAALSLATVAVGLDLKLQMLGVSINQPLGGHALGVTGLDHFWFVQPALCGISGDAQPPGCYAHGHVLT